MSIKAVIGAQYGDEGKGLMVDYLSDRHTLVVRYNGGAQAGHTVVTPKRTRHEFHHFGAGTFQGASTLLSRFFIVNPLVFGDEERALKQKWGAVPRVYVDHDALVTTPWDMLINREIEVARGAARHGSCGLGINETVERSLTHPLRVRDLYGAAASDLWKTLQNLRDAWVPLRTSTMAIPVPKLAMDDGIFKDFFDATVKFLHSVDPVTDSDKIQGTEKLVFEGAQGLRLDEKAEDYPYVTRSRTGLPNIITLLIAASRLQPIDIFYVTRAYTTRHGAGPLVGETFRHPYGWSGPETNETNFWQGNLRYAFLQTTGLKAAIWKDLNENPWEVHPHLAVTCLDQVGPWEVHPHLESGPNMVGAFDPKHLAAEVGIPLGVVSEGPTRLHVLPAPELFPAKESLADA